MTTSSIGTAPFPRMHVSLYVGDLARTIGFYNAFFGRAPEKTRPGYAKYVLPEPALIISFVENKDRVRANFGHLGIQVEERADLDRRLAIAREQGLVSKEEMGTACCYAEQDKFWATDPDGHQWEVYHFHADVEFNDPHFASADTAACCIPNAEKTDKVKVETGEACGCGVSSTCC